MKKLILLAAATAVAWLAYGKFRQASIAVNEKAVEKVEMVHKNLEKAKDAQERANEKVAEMENRVQEAFEE